MSTDELIERYKMALEQERAPQPDADSPYSTEQLIAEYRKLKPGPTAAYQQPESLFTSTVETQVRGAPTQVVQQPPKAKGWLESAARLVTGEGRKQEGVGEFKAPEVYAPAGAVQAAYRAATGEVPDPVAGEGFDKMLGDVLGPAGKAIGGGMDSAGAQLHTGLGFFLDANPRSRLSIIKKQFPNAEFRRDEYGNIQTRLSKTGQWAYVNKPGFSQADVQTLANEGVKFYAASKIPGLRLAKGGGSPAFMSAAPKLFGQGVVTTVAGQELAKPLGGRGAQAEDALVSGGANVVGGFIGHGLESGLKAAPKVAQGIAREVSDRLPGGAQRAVERSQQAALAQQAAESAARAHAETVVRASAAQRNLEGQALENAVTQAQDTAAAEVARQWSQPAAGSQARAIDRLAQSFGVRLAKAQTEGDQAGMQFMYEAAGGLHGPGAQRQAQAFLQAQNEALPQAIKSIAGDAGVTTPQSAVSAARAGTERAAEAAKTVENAAWQEFDAAVPNVRTYDVTPAGRPGAVSFVRDRIKGLLVQDKKLIKPEGGEPVMLPEFEATYPKVARALSLIDRMATSSKAEMPLRDVDRVIQLKRFIDAQWEAAETPAERRILTMMGTEVRDWLKQNGGGYVKTGASAGQNAPGDAARTLAARGANKTGDALQKALGISADNAKRFRENKIIADMLDARSAPTDEEVSRRIFGGGDAGLTLSSDSVEALKALKTILGPSSPEWEGLRQAALLRLTRGLDDAVATNQTPAILTTFKRIEEAFRKSREGMGVLFTPEELARLREAQKVVSAMAPPAKNPVNPSGSGLVASRTAKGLLTMVSSGLRNVPGANVVVGTAMDVGDAARVSVETQGAAGPTYNIAREIGDLWNVRPSIGGPAYASEQQAERSARSPEPGYYPEEDRLPLGVR